MTDLEIQILAILLGQKEPTHGLSIGAQIEDAFNRVVGPGSLYRALNRLHQLGLVSSTWEDDDLAAHQGPPRRYYEISDLGAQAFHTELQAAETLLKTAKLQAGLS